MTQQARMTSGIIILTVPTIAYGGYFLLTILSGQQEALALTEFQKAMFRAGHAHAGVLVLLALIMQPLLDVAVMHPRLKLVVRMGFPLAAILVSAGFFGAAAGTNITEPTSLIGVLYAGTGVLIISLLATGVGLIRKQA
jgi:hypothetical protein